MKRKWIALGLCVALLTGTTAAAWPTWAETAKTWAEEKNMSQELLEEPLAAVTRGQAARMIYEAAGSPAVSGEAPFSDLSSDEIPAVTWAAEEGYVQGVGGGRYAPDRPVTRQEFAAMLYRGAGEPAYEGDLSRFSDGDSVSEWARAAMGWCVDTGRMNGKSSNSLAPQDTIRVAEALLMLRRAETGSEDNGKVAVSSWDGVKKQLQEAITAAKQPPAMELQMDTNADTLEMDVRNIYYALLSEHPELKYAYEFQMSRGTDGLLRCTISYMPYRTGDYPEGFQGVEVDSLAGLVKTAQEHLDAASTPIRITNAKLTVDDMNWALQQVGGSYFLCQLNRDATEIVVTPLNGMSVAEAKARLKEIDSLADAVLEKTVDDSMTDLERAEALYTYLTDTVRYDQRYYSDRNNMPYESLTAYGALKDGLAICGGYAQALQTLFTRSGIPCYTVSGKWGSEYHMWNVAYVDGAWRYFDATSDRGMSEFGFRSFNVTADELTGHEWDESFVERLTEQAVSKA